MTTKIAAIRYSFVLAMCLCCVGCAFPKRGGSVAERRNEVMKMHDNALEELYARDPVAREKIEAAAGYGVFSNIGTNLLLVTTEGGYGVAVDHETGERAYMKMVGAGLGLGIGAKDTRLIFIFQSQLALEQFMSGSWAAGADADAAGKVADAGGEQSVTVKTGDVEIYTITRNGLALSATINGTRFYRDGYLNSSPKSPAPSRVETAHTD
jgi:lipid-binding SYLF domain-containing protein